MKNKANIRLEIDPSCKTPEVIIRTDKETELIEKLVYSIERCVEGDYPQVVAYKGDAVTLFDQWNIVRIYTENRKVIVCTDNEEYESRLTLHDLEELLDESIFVRISRFEIVNLKKISGFDLSIAGTIRIAFTNGNETWVARRYVRDISEKLNPKGKRR